MDTNDLEKLNELLDKDVEIREVSVLYLNGIQVDNRLPYRK